MKYLLTNEESNRLNFRLLDEIYFDNWLEFFKEPNTVQFIGLDSTKTPTELCRQWFDIVNDRYKNDLGGMNALIDKNTNTFIGQCGLLVQEVDGITELEIGYSILPAHRNKGYASEAATKCRDFAFSKGYRESLISIIHVDNIRSEKVAIKNGMTKTKQTEFRGMPVNVFRIDKHEWLKSC